MPTAAPMMRTMTGRANRPVFSCTAWRIRLHFPSATTTVNTGFCRIRVGIVLSYVVDLSILPDSMSFATLHFGRACLTVCFIDCGVRICVYFVHRAGCRQMCTTSTAARSVPCPLPSSTLAGASPNCGTRAWGTQRLNVLMLRLGTSATVLPVRPASHVELASQARFADGRTSGTFRAQTTHLGWCTLICKAPSMWSPVTVSTTACS